MPLPIKRIFVYGFPGKYGGAGTELHHQVIVWLHMGLDVNIIPSNPQFSFEPLFSEMIERGVKVHNCNDWSKIHEGDPIIGFCNSEFLESLPDIRLHTKRTIFVNCMTWIFPKERLAMSNGQIAMFLYQNSDIMLKHEAELKALNRDPEIRFATFRPYFCFEHFPVQQNRDDAVLGCGRISRQDADKYSKNTLHIYEYFVSPKWKQGLFLGFDDRSEAKIGKPYDWIRVAPDHNELSQQEFYCHCDIVLQPSDTTENWPRIGFEAMSSGSVLIVDNRGGWKQQIIHGKTGWLCDHERDFIFYASKMSYEPNLRADMAEAARIRARDLAGLNVSIESWQNVFESMAKLPS
jgi:glycosyltransferase involved in cell wall biosynthesis